MHKMSEKCSSWKTVVFGWGGSREWRGGEREAGAYNIVQRRSCLLYCLDACVLLDTYF